MKNTLISCLIVLFYIFVLWALGGNTWLLIVAGIIMYASLRSMIKFAGLATIIWLVVGLYCYSHWDLLYLADWILLGAPVVAAVIAIGAYAYRRQIRPAGHQ